MSLLMLFLCEGERDGVEGRKREKEKDRGRRKVRRRSGKRKREGRRGEIKSERKAESGLPSHKKDERVKMLMIQKI